MSDSRVTHGASRLLVTLLYGLAVSCTADVEDPLGEDSLGATFDLGTRCGYAEISSGVCPAPPGTDPSCWDPSDGSASCGLACMLGDELDPTSCAYRRRRICELEWCVQVEIRTDWLAPCGQQGPGSFCPTYPTARTEIESIGTWRSRPFQVQTGFRQVESSAVEERCFQPPSEERPTIWASNSDAPREGVRGARTEDNHVGPQPCCVCLGSTRTEVRVVGEPFVCTGGIPSLPPADCDLDPMAPYAGPFGDQPGPACVGDPIDLETGAFVDRMECLSISGVQSIRNGLSYDSQLAAQGRSAPGLPAGWTLGYTRRAIRNEVGGRGLIVLYAEHGRELTFEASADGSFLQAGDPSLGRFTVSEDGSLELRRRDGGYDRYDPSGALVATGDVHGNETSITWWTTSSPSRMVQVVRDERTGLALYRVYQRSESTGSVWRLVAIEDAPANRPDGDPAALREYRISYDARGRISSIETPADAAGETSRVVYSYEADDVTSEGRSLVSGRCDANGRCVVMDYERDGSAVSSAARVVSQTEPNGVVLTLDWTSHPEYDLEVVTTHPERPAERHFQRFQHDANRRLVRTYAQDSESRYASVSYDNRHRVVSETDVEGLTVRYERNAFGDVTRMVVGEGSDAAETRYENHDSFGTPRLVTDPDGLRTEVETDPATGDVLAVWDLDGGGGAPLATRFEYDELGRVTVATMPDGMRMRWSYDARGRLDRVVYDEEGLALVDDDEYDWRGLLVRRRTADGVEVRYEYDARSRLTREQAGPDSDVRITSYGYDAAGNLVRLVEDDRDGGERATWAIEWDIAGSVGYLPVRVTSPRDDVVERSYGLLAELREEIARGAQDDGSDRSVRYAYTRLAEGWRTEVFASDGERVATLEENDRGDLVRHVDGRGVTVERSYDALGRLARVLSGGTPVGDDGGVERTIPVEQLYGYLPSGRLRRIETRGEDRYATSSTVSMEYDGLGRLRAWVDGVGRRTEWTYDVAARTTTRVEGANDPAARVSHRTVVDALGRVRQMQQLSRTGALTSVEEFEYEPSAADDPNRVSVHRHVDPSGAARTFRYDALGDLREVVADAGSASAFPVRYAYDRRGRLSREEHPNGLSRERRYDRVGQLRELVEQAGTTTRSQRWTYRPHGALSAFEDFDGTRTRYGYDLRGRLSAIDYGAGSTLVPEVRMAYLPNDLLLRVEDSLGTTTYGYDSLNRMARQTRNGRTLVTAYDDRGAPRWMGHFGGTAPTASSLRHAVTYRYDDSGALDRMSTWAGTGAWNDTERGHLSFFERNARGQLTRAQRVFRGVTGPDAPVASSSFRYDDSARLERIDHRDRLQPIFSRSYDRNARGDSNLTETVVRGVLTRRELTFDGLRRIRQVAERSGSDAERVFDEAYDQAGNRVTSGLVFDGFGRIVNPGYEYDGRGNLTFDGRHRYSYDAANRLVRSERNGVRVEYGYDGLGNLVRSSVNGRVTDLVLDESGDLPRVVEELRPDGREVHYAWGPTGLTSRAVYDRNTGAPISATLSPRVVLVVGALVGDPARLRGDDELVALMNAAGLAVSEVDDDALAADLASRPDDYETAALVVVSASVFSDLMTPLRTVRAPLLNLEPRANDELAMSRLPGNANNGQSSTSSVVRIVDPAHPLAAGLEGNHTVRRAPSFVGWARPADTAQIVATLEDATRPTLFAYEYGATLVDGTAAPDRRVFAGWPFLDQPTGSSPTASIDLTLDGERLLRAAIQWAAPRVLDRALVHVMTDELGSVVSEIDSTGGAVSDTAYTLWGRPVPSADRWYRSDGFGFTGEWRLPDGNVHLRARTYHPELGRFLQRDTFPGFGDRPQSLNRYSYVENHPTELVDPTGHFAGLVGSAIGWTVADMLLNPEGVNAPMQPCERVSDHPAPPWIPLIGMPSNAGPRLVASGSMLPGVWTRIIGAPRARPPQRLIPEVALPERLPSHTRTATPSMHDVTRDWLRGSPRGPDGRRWPRVISKTENGNLSPRSARTGTHVAGRNVRTGATTVSRSSDRDLSATAEGGYNPLERQSLEDEILRGGPLPHPAGRCAEPHCVTDLRELPDDPIELGPTVGWRDDRHWVYIEPCPTCTAAYGNSPATTLSPWVPNRSPVFSRSPRLSDPRARRR